MPQSLAQLYVHLIFSSKNREPIIGDPVHADLQAYFGGTLRELHSPAIAIGTLAEHAHLLYRQSKNISLANLVEQVKKSSSRWIKSKGSQYAQFHWQNGYGAFSVSASKLETVKQYVSNQQEHHRRVTFQEEFRRFLKEYGLKYDERYVWD